MQISKHFSLKEMVRSQTAINHRMGNMPNPEQLKSIIDLVNKVLEPVRIAIGMPIKVSSGFRSHWLNDEIGGATNSQHTKGEAADLQCADNAKLFNHIKDNYVFDQLIWEFGNDNQPHWVHVSYTHTGLNRFMLLKAVKENGKTKYIRL